MQRILTALLASSTIAGAGQAEGRYETSAGSVEVQRVISGLATPWSISFLPDGSKLVTERGGRLLHVDGSGARAVAGVPDVWASGQGGLLDVVVARDFPESREIFLTYAEPRQGGTAGTALAVARLSTGEPALEDVRVIWRMADSSDSRQHFGSRVVEAKDGTLFVTTGDRGERDLAQDLGSHAGKLIRVGRNGEIPSDNPFADESQRLPEIWSYGLRNLQGIALGPDGTVWTVMHGPRGGDEVNAHRTPGLNYGWPVQSFGAEYRSGRQVGTAGPVPGMEAPAFVWEVSPAVSGLVVYSGRLFPEWSGDLLTGALQHDTIIRLTTGDDGLVEAERLLEDEYARIRDVREAPDGSIWFIAESEGAIYRMTPAPSS
jgi:glucose/arabinose dehydrogenase